ncbi:MAG: ABC transporter substrate-binding protein [Caulobacteraceae bacterium]|nr:ABC transporter substrate-binding protein [Caulobacteraceae bacterium]
MWRSPKLRRLGLGLVVAAGLCLGLAGCQKPAAGGGSSVVLKVASQKGGARALIEASHALDGAPYKVEWSEFPSAQTLLEALNAGAIDLGAVGDAPFMFAYASGAPIKVVQAYRASAGGEATALVVKDSSPLHDIAELKGKRIGTSKGSIGHYLVLRALRKAGLKPTDVTMVYLSPSDAKAALAAGSVDVWATWMPYIALSSLHGGGRVLVDGRGLLHGIGFEAANQAAIDGKRAQVLDFLGRLAKAQQWEAVHEDEFAAVLAKETGLPLDVAKVTVTSQRPVPIVLDAAVTDEERETLADFEAAKVIEKAPKVEAAFDPSFNSAVKP